MQDSELIPAEAEDAQASLVQAKPTETDKDKESSLEPAKPTPLATSSVAGGHADSTSAVGPKYAAGKMSTIEFRVFGRKQTGARLAYFLREAFDRLPDEVQQRVLDHWFQYVWLVSPEKKFLPWVTLFEGSDFPASHKDAGSRRVIQVSQGGFMWAVAADMIDVMPDYVVKVVLGIALAGVDALIGPFSEEKYKGRCITDYSVNDDGKIFRVKPLEYERYTEHLASSWGFEVQAFQSWLQQSQEGRPTNRAERMPIRRAASRKKVSRRKPAVKQRKTATKNKKPGARGRKRGQ